MKFIRRIFFIFSLVSILLIGTSFADTGKVNVSATRIRKENNTNSDIITNIYENDKVEIIGDAGEWYKVKYNENTGYVKKEYLTVDKKDNTSTSNKTNTMANSVSEKQTNNVNTNSSNTTNEANNTKNEVVNNVGVSTEDNLDSNSVTTNSQSGLRNLPSMISTQVAQVEASKKLTILNEMGKWVQVTDGTVTGWIARAKIVVSNSETVNSSDFTNTSVQNQISNTVSENKTNNIGNKDETNTNTNKTQTNTISNENTVNKTGIINVETAKVREAANSSAKVIQFLDYNDKVTIIAEDGEWYKITSTKASGYVNKRLITIQNGEVSSRSLSETREEQQPDTTVNQEANSALNSNLANNTGNQVADYAKQYIGYSYVSGGKKPETGFDCSGFTKYVYSNFGYSLGNTAASQTNIGTEISRENLNIGDLILFYNEGKTSIGHTGIYLGNGEFVHAANPSRGVVTDNLNTNSYYNERFISARRIIQ